MRLPYLQLAMEVIEQAAPDLAVALDWTEEAAGWGLVHLFRWGLHRCPDDRPPSESSLVEGPLAARLIANAARWKGDPEALITALAHVKPEPLVERVEGGIRLCGLSRYDAAYHAAQGRADSATKAARARWKKPADAPGNADAMRTQCAGNADAMPERCHADATAMREPCASDATPMRERCHADATPMPQNAKTQTQTQTHVEALPPPRAGASERPVPQDKAPAPVDVTQAAGWWVHAQERRAAVFPNAVQEPPPADFRQWWPRALAGVKGGATDLSCAWEAYLADPKARETRPVASWRFFAGPAGGDGGAWRQFVPGQDAGAAPAREPARPQRAGYGTLASQTFVEGETHGWGKKRSGGAS